MTSNVRIADEESIAQLLQDLEDSGSSYEPSSDCESSSEDEVNFKSPTENDTAANTIPDATVAGTVRPRKRTRNESSWIKNKRMMSKVRGMSYTNTSGRIIPQKIFNAISTCCKDRECHTKFSPTHQKFIFEKYYELANFDKQTAFIFSQVTVKPVSRHYRASHDRSENKVKNYTRLYFLPNAGHENVQVCKTFFKKVLAVSDGRLDRVLKTKKNNNCITPPLDQRGRHTPGNKISEEKIYQVFTFINKYPTYESHYSRNKSSRLYLSPDLNIRIMYSQYKAQIINDGYDFVSEKKFREIFNTRFNLHFHPPVSDSCKTCDSLQMKIKCCTDSEETILIKQRLDLHHKKAENARKSMKTDSEIPINCDDTTVIAFDLMKTLPTPVLSTGLVYYKRQLWTYCLCIHNTRTQKAIMYVWDESVASRGPDEIGSCLLHFFKNFVTTKKVIMYSDCCGGQNRNIKISVLCNHVVLSSSYVVEQIEQKFLVSGHTYLPCDSDFGFIEKNKIHFKNIFVPSDWHEVITTAKKRNKFEIINMTPTDFFSTKNLMKAITHRKRNEDQGKVEWLKILHLLYQKDKPFIVTYRYGHSEMHLSYQLDLTRRRCGTEALNNTLPLLYPNGHTVTEAKKKDLLSLLEFIPPIHHNFYNNLKTSGSVGNTVSISRESESEEDE